MRLDDKRLLITTGAQEMGRAMATQAALEGVERVAELDAADGRAIAVEVDPGKVFRSNG